MEYISGPLQLPGMHPDAGGAKVSLGCTFETGYFLRLSGRVRKMIEADQHLHEPLADFDILRSFLRRLSEPGDSLLAPAESNFGVAQFAGQDAIVSGKSEGVAVGGTSLLQPAEIVECVAAKVLAEGAAVLVRMGCVQHRQSLVALAQLKMNHSFEQSCGGRSGLQSQGTLEAV